METIRLTTLTPYGEQGNVGIGAHEPRRQEPRGQLPVVQRYFEVTGVTPGIGGVQCIKKNAEDLGREAIRQEEDLELEAILREEEVARKALFGGSNGTS